MYAAVYFAGPRWTDMDSINTRLDRIDEAGKVFKVQISRFEKAAFETIEVGGESLAGFFKSGNPTMPSGSECRLHVDQAEHVIKEYDPTLREIEQAIDYAVSISGNRVRALELPPS
jgi:hypothetical protein